MIFSFSIRHPATFLFKILKDQDNYKTWWPKCIDSNLDKNIVIFKGNLVKLKSSLEITPQEDGTLKLKFNGDFEGEFIWKITSEDKRTSNVELHVKDFKIAKRMIFSKSYRQKKLKSLLESLRKRADEIAFIALKKKI